MKYSLKIGKNNLIFFIVVFILTFFTSSLSAQTIDVAETTLKVGSLGEEIFYYGFAEGDQMIFNFQEINGKELKELEIMEFQGSSKFMDYKTKKIENKTLNITKTGIYAFRFTNSALTGRICKVKIQRIPVSDENKNFNSSVYWKTIYDTTYTTVQEKYLVKTDTIINNLTDQIAKVHSQGNVNGNRTSFNFTIPNNTIAWSYYVGVDQAGQSAYESAARQLSKSAFYVSRIPGYGPMAALAMGSVSYLSAIQAGEDVDYYIVDENNINAYNANQQFYYVKRGKVINDYSKVSSPLKGNYYMCLYNDNAITGITVTVKITAIVVNNEWGYRPIQKMHIKSRQEAYLKN